MTQPVYRLISIAMMVVFGLVGVLFLFMSDVVIKFFNQISALIDMEQVEPGRQHFFVVLATAYMYVVALLGFLMYRHPKEASFPLILMNAKLASAVISLFFFVTNTPLLIYLTNCVVDGAIGLLAIAMYSSAGRNSR